MNDIVKFLRNMDFAMDWASREIAAREIDELRAKLADMHTFAVFAASAASKHNIEQCNDGDDEELLLMPRRA